MARIHLEKDLLEGLPDSFFDRDDLILVEPSMQPADLAPAAGWDFTAAPGTRQIYIALGSEWALLAFRQDGPDLKMAIPAHSAAQQDFAACLAKITKAYGAAMNALRVHVSGDANEDPLLQDLSQRLSME